MCVMRINIASVYCISFMLIDSNIICIDMEVNYNRIVILSYLIFSTLKQRIGHSYLKKVTFGIIFIAMSIYDENIIGEQSFTILQYSLVAYNSCIVLVITFH